jgi:hypothetical protein
MKPEADFVPFPPTSTPGRATQPPLAPLLAGARARGVADGFEWLGIAAILLDDRGEALHANAGAIELMGAELYLQGGRLRARDLATDRALTEAISDAVISGVASRMVVQANDGVGVALRIAPMDTLDDDPYQLLRAVAVLEPANKAERGRH